MDDSQLAEVLRDGGVHGLTMRGAAQSLGVPMASLQYRVGSRTGLVARGLRSVAGQLVREVEMLEAAIPATGLRPADIAPLMRYLTIGASDAVRSSTLLLLEALLVGDPRQGRQAAFPWLEALERLWARVADAAGRDTLYRDFLLDMNLGIALHFCGADRRIERKLVGGEIIDASFAGDTGSGVWYRHFLAEAVARMSEAPVRTASPSPAARNILSHAAAIILSSGPHRLTYRTLAARADLSVSAVAHHFPSRETLFYAAYRHLHHCIIDKAAQEAAALTRRDANVAMRIARHASPGQVPLFLGYSAFELFAERDRVFGDLAAYFRMTRGMYHLRRGDPDFDPGGRESYISFCHSFVLLGNTILSLADFSNRNDAGKAARLVELELDHYGIG